MSKVTSKLQLTIPKAIAQRYHIEPGHKLDWEPAGDAIRLVPAGSQVDEEEELAFRLAIFDAATQRQQTREKETTSKSKKPPQTRGWKREDLYNDRGLTR